MPQPLPLYLAAGDVVGLYTIVESPCLREASGHPRTMVLVECQVCRRRKWLAVGKVATVGCRYCAQEMHGHARGGRHHPLYAVWSNMLQRCTNPKHPQYHNYGARGIKVCSQWRDATEFLIWAGSAGWEPGLQIDRRDNDGDYEPGNCRFVTPSVNASNRRPVRR